MKKPFGYIPINTGRWQSSKDGYGGAQDGAWFNIYFMEAAFDPSDLPPNTYGKLIVEFKDDRYHNELRDQKIKNPQLGKVGVRLAYQPTNGRWVAFKGSEVYSKPTKDYRNPRWLMGKSEWFPMPNEIEPYPAFDGVGLLWVQGMQEEGSLCEVAMVTLVLAVEE